MSPEADVVVVGGGINGLVAALDIAAAGRSVTLLERRPELGGFLRSRELTAPRHLHDVFATWVPEFLAGPYGRLQPHLDDGLLEFTPGWVEGRPITATVGSDGRVLPVFPSVEETAAGFRFAEDRRRYVDLISAQQRQLPVLGRVMSAEFSRLGGLVSAAVGAARMGGRRPLEMARRGVSGARTWLSREFAGDEVGSLWAPWLLHMGIGPDTPPGAFMIPVFATGVHLGGLPVVRGGVGQLVAAFERAFARLGVEVRTGCEVTGFVRRGGRVVGAQTPAGEVLAGRAVIASMLPDVASRLLEGSPQESAAGSARNVRGAAMLHVALDRPLQWADPSLNETPVVHLSDGPPSIGVAVAQAAAGVLPARPTVVVGRQEVLDPSRVPEGEGQLWIQLQEVPSQPVADGAGEMAPRGEWDAETREMYARRVLAMVDQHAPGVAASVREFRFLTPPDLAAHNVNAPGGEPYGGPAGLDDALLWRGGRGHQMAKGLWLIGAATHPGPGTGAGSGGIVAREVLRRR